jgi:hypothetical protein
LLGAICGSFVGYLGLASVGAVAVDLSDLTSLTAAFAAVISASVIAHRSLRTNAHITQSLVILALPISAMIT